MQHWEKYVFSIPQQTLSFFKDIIQDCIEDFV